MHLQYISPAFVDRAWADGASNLAKACDRAKGEVTADQLKMILARGERDLLCLINGEMRVGWMAVQVQQLPNMRVMYVYSLYAPHHSLDAYRLLKEKAAEHGCSAIRGSVDEANERLWRAVDAKKVYTVYEIEV